MKENVSGCFFSEHSVLINPYLTFPSKETFILLNADEQVDPVSILELTITLK